MWPARVYWNEIKSTHSSYLCNKNSVRYMFAVDLSRSWGWLNMVRGLPRQWKKHWTLDPKHIDKCLDSMCEVYGNWLRQHGPGRYLAILHFEATHYSWLNRVISHRYVARCLQWFSIESKITKSLPFTIKSSYISVRNGGSIPSRNYIKVKCERRRHHYCYVYNNQ